MSTFFWNVHLTVFTTLCVVSVAVVMSRRLMNDFIQLEAKATVAIEPDVALPTNQQMLLAPNDLCDLTPFGINKVLNKELPVVLQVIDIMEETPTAREKVTLIEQIGMHLDIPIVSSSLWTYLLSAR